MAFVTPNSKDKKVRVWDVKPITRWFQIIDELESLNEKWFHCLGGGLDVDPGKRERRKLLKKFVRVPVVFSTKCVR